MTYTQQHVICYLYVYTYKLRNPASFPDRRTSGKETGFLSLVYMYIYSIYTNTKVTYVHNRNLMSHFIYVHVYMLPTYTYICHLLKYPYVKDTHMHAYVIHMWYVLLHMAYVYVYMYICYLHAYIHVLPTYTLHMLPTYISYIHTYMGHMHIGMCHIDM